MGKSLTFLFAGGGTGGHLFPGIAVADELRARVASVRVVFVGSSRAIESTIIGRQGVEHRILPVEPLASLKRNPLRFAVQNWRAWRAAGRLLKEIRPDAVVGLGGLASVPIVIAAAMNRRIPIVLLEPNLIPGKATRWLSRYATHVCVWFPETGEKLPRTCSIVATGNPVRAEIAAFSNSAARMSPSSASKRELLILGGSQGADSLNDAVLAALAEVRDSLAEWNIVHQTGPRQVESVRQRYQQLGLSACVESFFHDMPQRYAAASLVISRAGATTLAELACAGVAMILLPFPHAADDHQSANAQAFSGAVAAVMVRHASTPDATAKELALALKQLLTDSDRRSAMGLAARTLARPHAAQGIADAVLDAVNQFAKLS